MSAGLLLVYCNNVVSTCLVYFTKKNLLNSVMLKNLTNYTTITTPDNKNPLWVGMRGKR